MKRMMMGLAIMVAAVLAVMWTPGVSGSVSLIGKAYASEHGGSKDGESKDHGSKDSGSKDGESKDHGSKDSGSKDTGSYSTQTPICDCTGLVASANSDAAKADEEATKADREASKADEEATKAKEDADKAKEDADKTVICHVPPGNSGNPQTLYLPPSAVSAHLREHAGDYIGACSGDDSKDKQDIDKAKSEADKCKSDADKNKSEADKNKSEADKNKSEADKAKSEADSRKSEMDSALSMGGDPCTCSDGSTGTWLYGNPGDSASPKSLRQIRGQ